jgi:hypothetical protein
VHPHAREIGTVLPWLEVAKWHMLQEKRHFAWKRGRLHLLLFLEIFRRHLYVAFRSVHAA